MIQLEDLRVRVCATQRRCDDYWKLPETADCCVGK